MLHNFFIVRLCYMLALFIASKNNYTMPCLFVINSHFVVHVYFKHNEKMTPFREVCFTTPSLCELKYISLITLKNDKTKFCQHFLVDSE